MNATLMPHSDPPREETGCVAGFMFDKQLHHVALIRKSKPAWQRGKLNGIGGHVEIGESILQAMVREFEEEADRETEPVDWHHYARLKGPEFRVDFFVSVGDLEGLESPNDEQIEILDLSHIDLLYAGMIENLPWLIALALDYWNDGRPSFAQITYPPQNGSPVTSRSTESAQEEGISEIANKRADAWWARNSEGKNPKYEPGLKMIFALGFDEGAAFQEVGGDERDAEEIALKAANAIADNVAFIPPMPVKFNVTKCARIIKSAIEYDRASQKASGRRFPRAHF